MNTLLRTILLGLAVMLSGASCQNGTEESGNGSERISSGRGDGTGRNSLYERIGGEPVMEKVVHDTIERARVDTNINWSRPGAPEGWRPTQENFEEFKEGLTRYVSQQIGGPYKYEGEDMRSVHRGMRITDDEFDAFVNHLRAALANNNVPEKEKQELVRVFEKTRGQIVQQEPRQQREADRTADEDQRSR